MRRKQPPKTPKFERIKITPRYEKTSSRQRPNNAKSPKPNKNFHRTLRSDTRRIKEKLHSACVSYPNCVPVLTAPSCSICSMVSSEPIPQLSIRFSSHFSTCAQGQFSVPAAVNTNKQTYRMELSAQSKSSPPTKRHRNRAPMTTLNLMPF